MSWHKVFNRKSYPEFSKIKLTNVTGKIPKNINGVLYKNTSACLERNGEIRDHWFDGDGAILKLNIQNGEIDASYKFVKTESYIQEQAAQKFIQANLGNVGKTWQEKFKTFFPANRSNTSVLPVEGKLLTLWEGGNPYSLDLDTLETLGEDGLGVLKKGDAFTAHPKVDPDTGLIYSIGPQARQPLSVYKCDKTGNIIKRNSIKLEKDPFFTHDVCLAGRYLVLFNFPFTLNPLPLIFRMKPMLDSMGRDKNRPTEIVIIDKETLELVTTINAHNFFSFHFSNGFTDQNGNIVIDHVEYDNISILMNYTKDIVKGNLSSADFDSKFVRFTIDPKNRKIISRDVLFDKRCEFPTIQTKFTGKKYENTFMSLQKNSKEFITKIANVNFDRQNVVERDFGQDVYPGESIHIDSDEGQGYLINVSYNAKKDKSDVHIINAENLEDIAVAEIPHGIPFGFHGVWKNTL